MGKVITGCKGKRPIRTRFPRVFIGMQARREKPWIRVPLWGLGAG